MWTLVGAADRGEGLEDFWLEIARVASGRRAGWIRPLTHAATLGDAIRAMCASYVRKIPMIQLGLSVDGPVAWFWRRRVADIRDWEGDEPAEQYTLSFMLEVVRSVAGTSWLPETLVDDWTTRRRAPESKPPRIRARALWNSARRTPLPASSLLAVMTS